jgi:hypothetical protein
MFCELPEAGYVGVGRRNGLRRLVSRMSGGDALVYIPICGDEGGTEPVYAVDAVGGGE